MGDLKAYLNYIPANTTYKVFDIFYRTINETPLQISYINNTYGTGTLNLYSAWPLFVDSSAAGGDTSINQTAPNWIAQGNTNLANVYTTFWSKLSAATNGFTSTSKLKWEAANINSLPTYSNSTYMQEYNAQGYTGRFLIDTANGCVALPILNNAFVRSTSGNGDFDTSEIDTLQNITGTFDGNVDDGTSKKTGAFYDTNVGFYGANGGPGGGVIGFDASRIVRTSNETKPKNIHFCPYMQIANTITDLSVIDINAALIGYSVAPATIPQVAATTTSGNTLSLSGTVTPYNLYGGLTTAGNQNLATNGFQKLPGGLIIQWGTFVPLNGGRTSVISFPIPFPTNIFSLAFSQTTVVLIVDPSIIPGLVGTPSLINFSYRGATNQIDNVYYIAIGN